MSLPFVTSAPGKVILFGEHSAVYDKRAIAASINSLRTYLYTSENSNDDTITLDFPDIELHHTWQHHTLAKIPPTSDHDSIEPHIANNILQIIQESNIVNPLHINAAFCFLYLYKCLIPLQSNIRFKLISTSPIGAGLGSSAAISVVLSHAMLHLSSNFNNNHTNITKDLINKYAFLGEKCIHGNPSGIDNLVSTHGGAISYQRNGDTRILDINMNHTDLLLTYTKVPRSTKTLVAHVKTLHDSMPQIIEPVLQSMHTIAIDAERLLLLSSSSQNDNTEGLAKLIAINQALLQSLGVSHESIERVKLLSDNLGIGPTKLTGAGGGGCTFTLIQDKTHLSTFKEILNQDYQFETIETQLGGPGCLIVPRTKLTPQHIEKIDILFNGTDLSRSEIDEILLPGPNQFLPWD
ncbi:mevalonate kinase [Monosporozyma servazzii]